MKVILLFFLIFLFILIIVFIIFSFEDIIKIGRMRVFIRFEEFLLYLLVRIVSLNLFIIGLILMFERVLLMIFFGLGILLIV